MKFVRLEIRNFLAVGEAQTIRLDDVGLILIQGTNEDEPSANSNGSGKSTIPDALMWCLFGETARGVSGDLVVNDKSKRNCRVEVDFVDGDTVYTVTRYRKDKIGKNSLLVRALNPSTSTSIVLEKGTERDTQEVINALVGCSKDVFLAAVYAGQEVMPDLPKMTDKQLKVLIEEAAGVERLEKAYEKARAKVSEFNTGVTLGFSKVVQISKMIESLTADAAAAEANVSEFEDGRTERAGVYLREAEELKGRLTALIAEYGLKSRKADSTKLSVEREKILGSLKDHSKLMLEQSKHESEVTRALMTVNEVKRKIDFSQRSLNVILSEITQAPEQIGCPCPTCGKLKTEEDTTVVVANLVKKSSPLEAEIESLYTSLHQAEQDHADKALKLQEFQKQMPDVSALTDRLGDIDLRLSELQKIKNAINAIIEQRKSLKERSNAAMTEPNIHMSALKHIAEMIRKQEDEKAVTECETKTLEFDLVIWKEVMDVFSPSGVRAHILDTVTPFLNERTSEYLTALSDESLTAVWSTLATSAKGDIREKFNIEVENASGAKCFVGLSGGEKRKVRLATMLALQDLVATRATKPIDLWIGDEIDHALDSAGLERLMGILEAKARERGTVLVISHNELTDWSDNVMTVTKSGGYSKLTGAAVL